MDQKESSGKKTYSSLPGSSFKKLTLSQYFMLHVFCGTLSQVPIIEFSTEDD